MTDTEQNPIPLPYQFLNDLAAKRTRSSTWVSWLVFHVLITPKIPLDYLLFSLDGESTDWPSFVGDLSEYGWWKKNGLRLTRFFHYVFRSWFIAVVVVGLYVCVVKWAIPRGSERLGIVGNVLVWLAICICINMLSLAVLFLFAQPATVVTDAVDKLSGAVEELKNDTSRLGPRLWAGERTYGLLATLNDHKTRAKWMMVNFLSEEVDHLIETDIADGQHSISSVREWSVSEYSEFLRRQMGHADHSVYWIVSPRDFFHVLLPTSLTHFLASTAMWQYGIPRGRSLLKTDKRPSAIFRKDNLQSPGQDISGYPSDVLLEICNELRIKFVDQDDGFYDVFHAGKKLPLDSQKEKEHSFFELISLNILKEYGIRYLRKRSENGEALTSEDMAQIEGVYRKSLRPHLDALLPHVKAFQEASHDLAKMRLLYFGTKGALEDNIEEFITKALNSQDMSSFEVTKSFWWPSWGQVRQDPDMLVQAFNFFLETCGGKENFGVAAVNDATYFGSEREADWAKNGLDIGIYDEAITIASVSPKGNDDKIKKRQEAIRQIEISYYGGAKKIPQLALVKHCSKALQNSQPTHKDICVLNADEFRKAISNVRVTEETT